MISHPFESSSSLSAESSPDVLRQAWRQAAPAIVIKSDAGKGIVWRGGEERLDRASCTLSTDLVGRGFFDAPKDSLARVHRRAQTSDLCPATSIPWNGYTIFVVGGRNSGNGGVWGVGGSSYEAHRLGLSQRLRTLGLRPNRGYQEW